MTWIYFLILALLVASGFLMGAGRARALRASGGTSSLHSLPTYHGLFLAAAAFVPMLLIIAFGVPLGAQYIQSAALSAYDPSIAADPLKAGAALRDMELYASGLYTR